MGGMGVGSWVVGEGVFSIKNRLILNTNANKLFILGLFLPKLGINPPLTTPKKNKIKKK